MAKDAGLPPEIKMQQIIDLNENNSGSLKDVPLENDNVIADIAEDPVNVLDIDATDKLTHRVRQDHTYAAKKTVAQGMMDVALITANANQLRYLVEYQRHSPTFWFIVFLIVISLLLQIAVGVSLIFKGRFDIKGKSKSPQARRINNYVVVGVFLITITNVFVAAFSVTTPPVVPNLPAISNGSTQ